MKPRIIVCGLGRTGQKILSLLRQQGAAVVGISDRPLPGQSDGVILGDATAAATLAAAGIATAQTLVLAGDLDSQNLAILMQARLLNPKVRLVHRLYNTDLGDRLDRTLADHSSLSVSALAAPAFVFAALGSRAIGQLRLFNSLWPMREEYVDADHPWCGRPLADLWEDRSRMLIDYLPVQGEAQANLMDALRDRRSLRPGDRLIAAARPTRRSLRLTWRDRLRETLGSLARLRHQGRPAVIALAVLALAIATSTVLYGAVNAHVSVVEAFYFAVGTITGAGGKEETIDHAPDAVKVYTALLMLAGAGIVGICYALLNDYILGTRFQQVLEVARLPQRGHFIVAGLGGLGLKTARELRAQGCEVVVIERDGQHRFLATARSLHIPVVIGDATLTETLAAVRADRAEALLALTHDDLINLEIGLSGRAIAPRLRTVLRTHDPRSAMMVQQVFEFEMVLSPVELAAPTFAAAALGGRILGSGVTGDRLWVALGTLITPLHPLCGESVQAAAIDLDFVPLYLERHPQTLHGWPLLETHLAVGDVLYLSIPARHLDRLWRVASDRLFNPPPTKQFK